MMDNFFVDSIAFENQKHIPNPVLANLWHI